ncbi:MAG: T9SS type A sorting domain-containing protein, partial [Ignavibacteriae bacterium]|nr:T9SS type A sorting domain-containing protein [Ignavibacteriota bacterium]
GIPANSYPLNIYFYNSRIGFANMLGYKTTNAGLNWFQGSGTFTKMHFTDSLNGFKALQGLYRTTNGGLNWIVVTLPDVIGYYTNKDVIDFAVVNKDTIYAVYSLVEYNAWVHRGLLYKTTNRGLNWGYQLPDTSFGIVRFAKIYAINNNVWTYTDYDFKGIHSTTGGDITIYTGIKNISTETPSDFTLEQNYPNPFNPSTTIKFGLKQESDVTLRVHDITGRLIRELVTNERHRAGIYEYRFDAKGLASGVYIYTLQTNSKSSSNGEIQKVFSRTMLLLK